MSTYHAPLADMRFVLFDVLGAQDLFARLGFADATPDIVDAVLEEEARFNENVLAPLNQIGDEAGCSFDPATGDVTTPPGFKQAYAQYVEGGWAGLTSPTRCPARPTRCSADAIDGGDWINTTSSRLPMSMPISSELVATIARSSPDLSRVSTSLRISRDREPWCAYARG